MILSLVWLLLYTSGTIDASTKEFFVLWFPVMLVESLIEVFVLVPMLISFGNKGGIK